MSPAAQSVTIQSLTPTLCGLMDVGLPSVCEAEPIPEVIGAARGVVRRALVYCPDALGSHVFERYPDWLAVLLRVTPLAIPLRSVTPSLTPVCYSSVFTGASPEQHGVRTGASPRPILRCDTLFDRMIAAGKRAAVIAEPASSIGRLFLDRAMDYYPENDDAACERRALELLEQDRHELIVVYHDAYDGTMHRSTPFSEQALRAARAHVDTAQALSRAVDRWWGGHRRVVVLAPDHGAHTDPATGRGTHGSDLPEDMDLRHFYRVSEPGA